MALVDCKPACCDRSFGSQMNERAGQTPLRGNEVDAVQGRIRCLAHVIIFFSFADGFFPFQMNSVFSQILCLCIGFLFVWDGGGENVKHTFHHIHFLPLPYM